MGFSAAGAIKEEGCAATTTRVYEEELDKSSSFLLQELEAAIERLLEEEEEEEKQGDDDDDNYAADLMVEHLPKEISRAAAEGNEEAVFGWLGLPPIPTNRMEATYRGRTLLHEAVSRNQTDLMTHLLQLGANVESKNSLGFTPLEQALCQERSDETARLLLTWGATVNPRDVMNAQNTDLIELLLQAPLGGRRCEIIGLKACPHFNGQTGVVIRVDPADQLHVFQLEETQEIFTIRSVNLQRRDRTPRDSDACFTFPRIGPRLSENPMEEWGIDMFKSDYLDMPRFDDDNFGLFGKSCKRTQDDAFSFVGGGQLSLEA